MSQKAKSSTTSFIQKMELLRYSRRTIDSYSRCVEELFAFCEGTSPAKISYNQVESFLYKRYLDGISWSTQNVYINAFNLWQELSYKQKRRNYDRFRPKRSKALPKPISQEQVRSGFSQIKNQKHLVICQLLYYCGMRREEVINLKFSWFNPDQSITITGKGNKERNIPCSVISNSLKSYAKAFRPKDYFINGEGGQKYSTSSIYAITKKYFHCSPHQLRHSCATHMVESGVNLRVIQEFLGHQRVSTTEVYTMVSTSLKREASMMLVEY